MDTTIGEWVKVADGMPIAIERRLYIVVARDGRPSGYLHQLEPGHGWYHDYAITHGFDSWYALPLPPSGQIA